MSSPDFERLEHRIRQIGRDIFARARRAEPSPLRLAWWQRQFLDWVMQDESLKVQLFRFIEAMPQLRGPRAVAAHLRQNLRGERHNGRSLPPLIDVATGYSSDDSVHARAVALAAQVGSMQMAGQFIAGATPAEAVASILRLRRAGMTFTLDVLGETVLCGADADAFARLYLELIDALSESAPAWPANPLLDAAPFGPLPRVNLSIKLSALSPKFDPLAAERVTEAILGRLRPVLRRAREKGAFVNIDMEHYAVKDLTYDIFMRVMSEPEFRDWDDVGIVNQAYLRDSERDLRRLIAWVRQRGTPITVRLVKGAYWDYETAQAVVRRWPIPVWTDKWRSDRHFERQAGVLLDNHEWTRPALASHNVRSLAAAMAMAEQKGVPPRTLEVQMLYGMGDPLKQALIELGQRVRIYTPFGELMPGMAYFIRRLLENTANEGFLRQSFSEHVPEDVLLAPPGPRPDRRRTPLPQAHAYDPDEDDPMTPFLNEPDTDFTDARVRRHMADVLRTLPRDERLPAFVAGRRCDGTAWHESRNPALPAEVMTRVAVCTPDMVDDAVRAAQAAQPRWADETPGGRAAILIETAARLRQRRFEFAARLILEAGKTWRDADSEVSAAIDALEFHAREIERLTARPRLRHVPGENNEHDYVPRGVAAAIGGPSRPLAIPAQMLAAALAAGNAVVLNAGLTAAGVAGRLFGLLLDAGLPARVAHLLFGDATVSAAIAGHPDISVVASLGTAEQTRHIAAAAHGAATPAGAACKRLLLLTKGVNTVIVDENTDLDEAVLGTLASGLTFAGQGPDACSRVVVVGAAYERFRNRLIAAAREFSVGPPEDPSHSMGPLVSDEAMAAARSAVQAAQAAGRVLVERRHDELFARTGGFFFGPVVVEVASRPCDAPHGMDCAAPILMLFHAPTLEAAMEMLHEGGPAGVGVFYSRSPENIQHVRRAFRGSALFINRRSTAGIVDRQPIGGARSASCGPPAGGADYLRAFMDVRIVSENVMRHGLTPVEEPEPEHAGAH